MEATAGDKDVISLIGFVDMQLNHYQPKAMRVSGGRLDICKMLTSGVRPSLLSFLYAGIQQAENNLPEKCPFKRVSETHTQREHKLILNRLQNVKYILRRMRFNPNNLPMYLPEYNFTISIKFFGNNANLFDLRVWGSYCELANEACLGKKTN